MTEYNPNASAQESEFKSVTKILEDAQALIAKGNFENAVNRIGDALAAAQVAMAMQAQRYDDALESTAKVQRITKGSELLGQLADRAFPEVGTIAQFYRENKVFDLTK